MSWGSGTIASKSVILLRITVLAWLTAKAISWKLWLADRVFPTIPVFDSLDHLPNAMHLALVLLSVTAMVAVFVFPARRIFILLVLAAEPASCLLDQMRWQPWEYQYLLTFFFFALSKNKPEHFLKLLALLFGATYFFSGLHKIGGGFLYAFWDKMILNRLFHFSSATIHNPLVHYSGLGLAAAEMAIGLGLFFARNKRWVAALGILMHLLILGALGPAGLRYNTIIWPWNLAMAAFLYVLSWNGKLLPDRHFFRVPVHLAVVALVVVLPFLNFAGRWDHYLSFNLYSGGVQRLSICTDNLKSHPELQKYTVTNPFPCGRQQSISPDKMAMAELQVPVYPQWRAYEKLKKQWLRRFPDMAPTFIVYQYPFTKANASEIP